MKSSDVPDLGIAVFDSHAPYHDKDVWSIVHQVASDSRDRLKLFLLGGDNLDCRFVSRFTEGQPRLRGNIKRDLDKFETDILKPLDAILPASCARISLTGNHELWAQNFLDRNEEFRGFLDIEAPLKKYGFRIIEQGGSYKRGKLEFTHGDVIGGSAETACRRALEQFCGNICFGHFHRSGNATKILRPKRKDKWNAWSLPCACRLDASYLKGKPTGWLPGFAVIEFFPDGSFNLYPILVLKGRAAYGGTIYRARKQR